MFTVVTGGSGSGKSAFAENLVVEEKDGRRIYIATMFPYDQESDKRIERHRRMRRGKNFETVECYTGLKNLEIHRESCVLLECMSNLVANEMFMENGAGEYTVEAVCDGIQNLRGNCAHLCVVTNEIFSEAATYEGDTRRYQEYLGQINRRMVEMADQAVEVVYGIPLWFKKGRDEERRAD